MISLFHRVTRLTGRVPEVILVTIVAATLYAGWLFLPYNPDSGIVTLLSSSGDKYLVMSVSIMPELLVYACFKKSAKIALLSAFMICAGYALHFI
jgi:hypothetical protein